MEGLKLQLHSMLDQAYEAELAYVAGLTDEQRQAEGQFGAWSPKDTLAHIAAWNEYEVGVLQAGSGNEPPHFSGGIDEINAGIYEEHQAWSWDEIMRLLDQSQEGLAAGLARLADDDLADPQRYEWTNGQPLGQRLAFTAYFHPLSHLARLLWDAGETQAAATLAEQTCLVMAALDDSDRWQGVQRYNLACFYALSGELPTALDLVRTALALHPDLAEWARQDEELAALWPDPEFQALTGTA
jgi:hypothetical protein